MITVESITKTYGPFTAVDDVSFVAQPGRVTGFLGPNGAGKSTTMRIIVGLTRATSGTATAPGRRYRDLPALDDLAWPPALRWLVPPLPGSTLPPPRRRNGASAA